ncbi:MAG TPA: phosphoglucosamine mutase, partial [Candidatus Bipolaricaulis anaerobius]|nr:phosphoglucosamine mutase [Candidatus Bipolaricaulis anaerobius]
MRYFGTDGVRGVAGVDLTADLAYRLGRAAGLAFRPGEVLLAQDTRLSGPALAAACASGLAAAGCDVDLAGVLPSPAVSHLVVQSGYDLGCVVSASHNPPPD